MKKGFSRTPSLCSLPPVWVQGIRLPHQAAAVAVQGKDLPLPIQRQEGVHFEDSPLGFDKWLPAIWLLVNAKNGISSHELGRALEVHQETAWHMLGRIRLAMELGSFEKLSGEIEADESYVGGLGLNMHKSR